MKTTVLALILSLLSPYARASMDTSVFTDKMFTALDPSGHDPYAKPCPYNLLIKEGPQGSLRFYTKAYNQQNVKLLFALQADDLWNQKDTATQKYFEFQSGIYEGSAYFSTHSSSPEGFYEILIQSSQAPSRMACRYSTYQAPRL